MVRKSFCPPSKIYLIFPEGIVVVDRNVGKLWSCNIFRVFHQYSKFSKILHIFEKYLNKLFTKFRRFCFIKFYLIRVIFFKFCTPKFWGAVWITCLKKIFALNGVFIWYWSEATKNLSNSPDSLKHISESLKQDLCGDLTDYLLSFKHKNNYFDVIIDVFLTY